MRSSCSRPSATRLPGNSAWQFFTIASNTGCDSVIAPLITRRISDVAVCCASVFFSSGRAFLDLALEARVRLLELGCHAVELLGELLQLVAGAHVDLLVQVARADRHRAVCRARIGLVMRRAKIRPTRIDSSSPATSSAPLRASDA